MTDIVEDRAVNLRERRERIATAAMQALLAGYEHNSWTMEDTAGFAVSAADALIKELDKKGPSR